MQRIALLLASVIVSTVVFASPVITSVTPNTPRHIFLELSASSSGSTTTSTFYVSNEQVEITPVCSQWPARLFYVPKNQSAFFTMNDRVLDVMRTAQSNATEIPIVRANRLTKTHIVLLGVPLTARRATRSASTPSTPSPSPSPTSAKVELSILRPDHRCSSRRMQRSEVSRFRSTRRATTRIRSPSTQHSPQTNRSAHS